MREPGIIRLHPTPNIEIKVENVADYDTLGGTNDIRITTLINGEVENMEHIWGNLYLMESKQNNPDNKTVLCTTARQTKNAILNILCELQERYGLAYIIENLVMSNPYLRVSIGQPKEQELINKNGTVVITSTFGPGTLTTEQYIDLMGLELEEPLITNLGYLDEQIIHTVLGVKEPVTCVEIGVNIKEESKYFTK